MVKLAMVPSTSVPDNGTLIGVSSVGVMLPAAATGASFTGLIVSVSVEVSVPPTPSATV